VSRNVTMPDGSEGSAINCQRYRRS